MAVVAAGFSIAGGLCLFSGEACSSCSGGSKWVSIDFVFLGDTICEG